MQTIVSPQIDYQPKIPSEPKYEYTRIFAQAGTTSSTLTAAGGLDMIYELPASKCFNFAKSWLQFSAAIANDSVADNMYAWVFGDFIPWFRQIIVYTRGGLEIMNLQDANLHSKMVMKTHKKAVETQTSYNSAPTTDTQRFVHCHSNNSGAGASITVRYDNTAADKPNNEPAYLLRGAKVAKSATSVTLNVVIPFSEIYETILSLDKDLMFNESILVKFVWAPFAQISWLGTSAANPITGAIANTLTAAQNITNMEMHLAVEKNLDIINSIQAKISSPEGMPVIIDYTYESVSPTLTGSNQSVTLRINRANGMTLKRIYHSVFDQTNPGVNRSIFYNDNLAGRCVASFYTQLNNNRLNQYDFTCASYDDYLSNKDLYQESSVLSPNVYLYNWCYVQDFFNGFSESDDSNLVRGIDLNLGEQKWDFIGTITANNDNLVHYDFIVCKRKLVVSNAGIVLV